MKRLVTSSIVLIAAVWGSFASASVAQDVVTFTVINNTSHLIFLAPQPQFNQEKGSCVSINNYTATCTADQDVFFGGALSVNFDGKIPRFSVWAAHFHGCQNCNSFALNKDQNDFPVNGVLSTTVWTPGTQDVTITFTDSKK
jgi:hypothetical protein